MVFILKNNLDKREFTFEVTDKADSSLFYSFDVTLPEGISDGEYTYYLKVNDKVVSRGLCVVGDYDLSVTNYEEEKGVEYYVYDGDSDNVVAYVDTKAKPEQSKTITIDKNGSYDITPDYGLVLNKVDVNVNVADTPTQTKSKTYTANGEYSIVPDKGYNLSKVDVNVNVADTPTQTKSKTYTANGEYSIVPDKGYNLSKVDVNVNVDTDSYYGKGVSDQKAKLVSTAITANGTYTKSDGYKSVTVNVAGTPTQSKTISATSNGKYTVTPDNGYKLDKVDVSVNVPTDGGSSNFAKKMIENTLTEITEEDLACVTKIGGYAFYETNITSVTIPSNITLIGEYAFSNCSSLTSITISSGVTEIGRGAFMFNPFTSITIPNTVSRINTFAFSYCRALTSITISRNITSIDDYVFSNCSSLTSVTVLSTTPPSIASTTFKEVPTTCNFYVPSGSVSAYKSATNWSTYGDRIQAIQ